MPLRLDNFTRNLFHEARAIRLLAQRLGQVREKERRQQHSQQISHPAPHQGPHIHARFTLPPQRSHSQPHRIPREQLRADAIDDDQADGESGALDQFRDSGVVLFDAWEAGGSDEGEEAGEAEDETAVGILEEGEVGRFVEVVEGGLVGLVCGVEGGEGAGLGHGG